MSPLSRRVLLASAALLLREAAAQAQQIPNANSPQATSSSSSALGLPLPALIVIIIVGAALALLAAYQLYRLTWRIRHKPAPLPTARSLLTPGTPSGGTPLGTPAGTATRNTGRSLSMLLQQEQDSPGVMWEHGAGAGVFAGMQAAHQRDSTASTAPGDALPFPGTPGGTEWERWSPLSPDFGAVGGNRTSSLTLPNAPFSSHPRDGSGGRSSVYSLPGGLTPPEGGRPTRRSVYAMSLYSTPHFPSSGASGGSGGSYTPPGSTRLAARTNPNRISGAPHHSQIEIVPPAPLGPPPGTVVADTKSTLNFTPMSGVGGADGGQEDWFKRVSSGGMAPGSPIEDDPLMSATPRSPETAHFASAPQTPLSAGFGFAPDRRGSVASSAVLRDSGSRSRPSSSGVLDGYGSAGAHGMSRSESENSGGSSFNPAGPFRDPSLTVAAGAGGFEGLQGAFATPSGSSRPESPLGDGDDESDSTRGRGRVKERPLRHSSVDGEVTMVAEPTSPLEALQEDLKRRARQERRREASGDVPEDEEPTEKIRSRPPSVHLAELLDRDAERERELHEDR